MRYMSVEACVHPGGPPSWPASISSPPAPLPPGPVAADEELATPPWPPAPELEATAPVAVVGGSPLLPVCPLPDAAQPAMRRHAALCGNHRQCRSIMGGLLARGTCPILVHDARGL